MESVLRLSVHRGEGRAYNDGAEGVVSALRKVERMKGMEGEPEQSAQRGVV